MHVRNHAVAKILLIGGSDASTGSARVNEDRCVREPCNSNILRQIFLVAKKRIAALTKKNRPGFQRRSKS